MSKMTPAFEQWTVYSAAQNLPAVLNDPNRGKQTNFFIKTWGDSFIEKTEIGRSPFLPEITYVHFESYLRKHGRRYKRHTRLSQSKLETNIKLSRSKSDSGGDADLSIIPEIFLKPTLSLNDAGTFNAVFPCVGIEHNSKSHQSGRLLQEHLSHYLDIVEVHIAKQVSQKSSAFFHAMTSHDTIMEQMGNACKEVRRLRSQVQNLDSTLSKNPLNLLGLARSRSNHINLLDKLRLMSTVLQTQPTLQLLLSSSDYVAALELISSTQDVLARELAGVTSLRHLPSQLKEMSRLIDKMLSTEFERYAAADLHRPLESSTGVVEPERLISLVAGLLRQNNLQFLEVYKNEAVTAAQALLKQLVIEQLVDSEGDSELCLTGAGEAPPILDPTQWLKLLVLAVEALRKLVKRVKDVHDVIHRTAEASAGRLNASEVDNNVNIEETEHFLTLEDYNRVQVKLKELLTSVCDYCHERLAMIVTNQSDKQVITAGQISELSIIVESFCELCTLICGRPSSALRSAFNTQASGYVQRFHSQRKSKLSLLLDAERWKAAEIPPGFQILLEQLASGSITDVIPSSPTEKSGDKDCEMTTATLQVDSQQFVAVGAVIILLRLVTEYCVCAQELPSLAVSIGRNLAELLKIFNSRTCQLVLGAYALRTAGLKTITSTNLALASRALQLVSWLIPHIRHLFRNLADEDISGLDPVERDIGHHIQELRTKILSIINILCGEQLNDWSARPPVPSTAFRNISRHLTKLHEAVSNVLPTDQVNELYSIVHVNFKDRLREQVLKMNIVNNGGPQHGVVTSELTFYLDTMKNLKVLTEKEISEKSMEDIWIKKS